MRLANVIVVTARALDVFENAIVTTLISSRLLLKIFFCVWIPMTAAALQQPGSDAGKEMGQQGFSETCAAVTQSVLCPWIEAGQLSDLRWPDFSDYRMEVRSFYLPFDYRLAWISENQPTSQARAIIHFLQDSDRKGLRAEDYDGPLWDERVALLLAPAPRPSSSDLAKFDLALTVSLMRYVSALHNGRINPRQLNLGLDIEHKRYKLAEFLRKQLVASQDVQSVLEDVEPPYMGYRRTEKALEQYLDLAREGEGDPLPPFTKTIRPGDAYAGAQPLAERLSRTADLFRTSQDSIPSNAYEGSLVEGVKHFQQRHGLPASGSIDGATFAQLITPFSRRVTQLQLSLERWRWLSPDLPSRFVVVNLPEFELRAYDDHHVSLSMRVVVGQAFQGHQTPVFQDQIEYLVFRPYWSVPYNITRKELVPLIKKDSAYLETHDFEVTNRKGEVVKSSLTGEKLLARLRSGQLEVRQKPGPKNSLGLIKFVFPNNYEVYLHGTPERALFARSRRAFSHGCIRVEDPEALAAWALHDTPTWTRARIQEEITDGADAQRVNLERFIPVLILYSTAFVGENGEIHFFEDLYGEDHRLEHALATGYPYPL
jgi:murein L,D-transpeptidase YcbB/YkuD